MSKLIKKLDVLATEASEEGEKILLLGDWNARIGQQQCASGVMVDAREEWPRVSEDHRKDSEGEKLLEFGSCFNLVILNGVLEGDRKGRATYLVSADSVLDIALASEELVETVVTHLRVCPRLASDHLPVELCLSSVRAETQVHPETDGTAEERLVWDPLKMDEYREAMKENLKGFIEEQEASEKWKQLRTAVWDAARACGMVKTTRRRQANIENWVDEEYLEQRRITWKALKIFVKDRCKPGARETGYLRPTGAKYWHDKKTKGHVKEMWARLKCGNVGKTAAKGFRNTDCRVCGEEEENLSHIFSCRRAREKTDETLLGDLHPAEKE
uniref:Uncharacterized protein n=1 Tax=Bracon brevicornis TaxID=1563983 RepID=A0A6V7L853_9HYME